MSFTVIIPARLSSSRLPNKPLADLGGKPMVVRVAERAAQAGAKQVIVATDSAEIIQACEQHQVKAMLTRADHASGTDRIAEVAAKLKLADDEVIVNVQGDEPLIDPVLIAETAALIQDNVPMGTAAHAVHALSDVFNPNVVQVVLDKNNRALYFSRAPIPWHRDGFAQSTAVLPEPYRTEYQPLRHIGIYAYTNAFLQAYPTLAVAPLEKIEMLEQLRALWHGYPIAVHVTDKVPEAGVDTPEDLVRVSKFFAS